MTRSLLVSVTACLILLGSYKSSFAQAGTLCIYEDPVGANCNLTDAAPGLLSLYVIHQLSPGAVGVRFSAPTPACFLAPYLSDQSNWLIIGDSQTGISVGYNGCFPSPVVALTIHYFAQGLSGPDCAYPVLPHPEDAFIEVTDCAFNTLVGSGGTAIVNQQFQWCSCPAPPSTPVLHVSPQLVDFGASANNKSFTIANAGGGSLEWTITESASWLSVSPETGTNFSTIVADVSRLNLMPGHYNASVDVTSNGGNATVVVEMDVVAPEPELVVQPSSLTFDFATNSDQLETFNVGTGTLSWTIATDQPWLSVAPASGIGHGVIDVTVDRTGLADGTYQGNVLVTSNGGDATVPVTMLVATTPVLAVSKTDLNFSPANTSDFFNIVNAGAPVLTWTVSTDQPWLSASPTSGSGNTAITVTVNPAGVPPGSHTGVVTVNSNGGSATVNAHYTPPLAFGGHIGIYADVVGNDCNLHDDVSGPRSLYVVHTNVLGATASQFAAPLPLCMTGASWLADQPVHPVTLGNSQTGISVGYGACMNAPIHVMSIIYMSSAASEACCSYPVVRHPERPAVEMVDCGSNLVNGYGSTSVVNPGGTCGCGTVAVHETTWGRVKAMYKE